MRRLTWLVAGAIGGIAAYRKLASLVGLARPVSRPRRPGPGGIRSFVCDVRAGMAEYAARQAGYIDRHAGRSGNTLVGQQQQPRRGALARGSDNLKDGR